MYSSLTRAGQTGLGSYMLTCSGAPPSADTGWHEPETESLRSGTKLGGRELFLAVSEGLGGPAVCNSFKGPSDCTPGVETRRGPAGSAEEAPECGL